MTIMAELNEKINQAFKEDGFVSELIALLDKYTKKEEDPRVQVKRWRDDEEARISGYWITSVSDINIRDNMLNDDTNYNVFVTKAQAKSALAMARISQIMANDERFGGVVTDEEWLSIGLPKAVIERESGKIAFTYKYTRWQFLAFHNLDQAELFLDENRDLVEQYLMID